MRRWRASEAGVPAKVAGRAAPRPLAAAEPGPYPAHGMETIGLIAAMGMEAGPLRRLVGDRTRLRLAGFPGIRFRLGDRDCHLVVSGMGPVRAGSAARALIQAAAPDVIVSFGVAGGVEQELRVTDLVILQSVVLLDRNALVRPLPLAVLAAETLGLVRSAAEGHGARTFEGTAVTTSGSQGIPTDGPALPHPVLEMETHGIAVVARDAGVPLIALRTLSDSVEEPIPFNLADFTDSRYNLQLGRILAHAIRHPGVIPRLARLQRNTARAAQVAAFAVYALLGREGRLIEESRDGRGQP